MKKTAHYISIILIYALIAFANSAYCQKETNIKCVVEKIIIAGNNKTKEKIILNELTFKTGEIIESVNLEIILNSSISNLKNKSLFNYITIDYAIIGQKIDFFIYVEERWYLWPSFSVKLEERNFNTWWINKNMNKISIGAGIEKYNFRGLNQKLKLLFYIGYKQNITITYNNIYLDKKGKHLLSISYYYNKQHQVNYLTSNNKHIEIKLNNNFAIEKKEFIIQYKYRYNLNTENTFFLKNESLKINDSIFLLNENYLSGYQRVRFIQLLYEFEKKYWDNKGYPLEGYYLKIGIMKSGIIPKLDNINSFYCRIQFCKYFELTKKFYFAAKIAAKVYIPKNQPYFLMDALGNNDYIRGFEYYVIDGNFFIINNNSFKFELLAEKILYFKNIPLKSFNKIPLQSFLTANFDYGYVTNTASDNYTLNNKLANKLLYSFGIGIDFVTYYDKILRAEYSFNNIGESDFFLHFKTLF